MTTEANEFWNRPCAASPLISYRYRGQYGWIMIGAHDDEDAIREAQRSVYPGVAVDGDKLEVWSSESGSYVLVGSR